MRDVAGYLALDLDNCIWDSDVAHFEAVNHALIPYCPPITWEEHLSTFKGLPTRRKVDLLVQIGRIPNNLAVITDIEHRKKEATLIAVADTKPRPEVTALLLTLKHANWQMCCCSNSIRATVQAVLLNMGIINFMDFYLSNEDVLHAKPSPQMYQKAAHIWHIQPEQMTVIEDGDAGKQAARQAGCRLIEVAGPHEVEPWLIHRILGRGRLLPGGARQHGMDAPAQAVVA
jgi:HAD superfamily hydrolase (TIGR01509 family)